MTFDIRFPEINHDADQDREYCDVVLDGVTRRIRFHDYSELYGVPGLYEQLFYDELKCTSPDVVVDLLQDSLQSTEVTAEDLRVLDLGAGNGMVGERLAAMGVAELVGVDIIPEAATAPLRDRPGIYDDYLVADMTALSEEEERDLDARGLNCLTSVAALGFGDAPPAAFEAAYELLEDDGFVAFCIKEDFLRDGEGSGFARMMRTKLDEGELEVVGERRYQHRRSAVGDPLHYMALVARKQLTTASSGTAVLSEARISRS
jgi:predicted TPR repeat methyltransferase